MEKELETKRKHTASHIMTAAVQMIYSDVKLGVGPWTDDGFYQDFDLGDATLSEKDLKAIEKKMRWIVNKDMPIRSEDVTAEQAREIHKGDEYKQELIDELEKEGATLSVYYIGESLEKALSAQLCEGPHLASTGELGVFSLTKIAGAYWRGDEQNTMLTRIYGVAFAGDEELEAYKKMQEEAKARDHRKLGKELDLFCFSDLVGAGLPMFTPNGSIIIEELQKHIEGVCRNYGFQRVRTPHLSKIDLFKKSGHADKFSDELFHVSSGKEHDFVLKPVQCPHQTQIYASRPRSYRDLPIRYMESEKQYRAEKSGEVGGLNRVYAITVEDGHSFCRVDQVKEEVRNMVEIIKDFYTSLGLWDSFWVSLSVRDYAHPEKYIGTSEDWDICENMLQEVSDEMGLNAKKIEGEAALYGPKIDFMFKSATGKEIQIPTVQLDFATPKRFDLTYTNENGEDEAPVMVHRAVLGSYERFLVMLIEEFAGKFPLWLSPEHVRILPVSEKYAEYAQSVYESLREHDIRVTLDTSNDSLGKKVRNTKQARLPYFIVIGDEEASGKTVTIEARDKAKETLSLEKCIEKLTTEIKERK